MTAADSASEAAPATSDDSPARSEPSIPTQPEPHPISTAIDIFVHRVRDIRTAAGQAIPAALKQQRRSALELTKRIASAKAKLASKNEAEQIIGIREINEANRRAERVIRSEVYQAIANGLYLALFSAFDAYTGAVLTALYKRKPAMFHGIDKQIAFSDLLNVQDIEELKGQIIAEEIESIRRKSYVEQFSILSRRFEIELTKFPNWKTFVECSQRRNLITHCGGVVNEQYLTVCSDVGIEKAELPKLGDTLAVGPAYLNQISELMIEVGIKLGQTLWRKTLPHELEQADTHIKETLYKTLQWETWKRAVMIGEFAVGLPNVKKELDRRVLIVNLAQAYLHNGEAEKAKAILTRVDWSASSADFQLAEAVLLGNFSLAAEIMLGIGKKGQMITEQGYHEWPLFKGFRESNEFLKAYETVYGRAFVQLARKDAAKIAAEAEAAQKETDDGKNAKEETKL